MQTPRFDNEEPPEIQEGDISNDNFHSCESEKESGYKTAESEEESSKVNKSSQEGTEKSGKEISSQNE